MSITVPGHDAYWQMCALCAGRLLNPVTRVEIVTGPRLHPTSLTPLTVRETFDLRGYKAVAELEHRVRSLDSRYEWVRVVQVVQDGREDFGIYAVTTVGGTAVCAQDIGPALDMWYAHALRGPDSNVGRW